MNEIFFNDIKSYTDLGIVLTYIKIQPPAPKITKSPVPYMNGTYDFSNLYGETTYDERIIKCNFEIPTKDNEMLPIKYSKILQWLMTDKKVKLVYSIQPFLYYMARVESAPSWEAYCESGSLDVEFVAYPFQYGKNTEGADIWDEFNFETDYAQETKFDVVGTKSIELFNISVTKITPSIICSTGMSIIKNGVTYNFTSGTTKDFRFVLGKGINNLTINGTGNIEFLFRKEVF